MQKLIAFLFLASQAFGQTINIAPTHQPYQLIVASVDVDPLQNFVSWEMSLDWNREEVGNTVYFCAPPGSWRIGVKTTALIDGKIGPSKRLIATFTVSGTPTPNPTPTPTPTPTPPPTPPPTPSGKITAVILHETEDDSPAFSQRLVLLRTGDAAKYLRDKGHRLLVVDDDSTDENGQPSQLVGKIKALGVPLPFVALLGEDGAVVKTMPLTDATTATDVLDVIKQAGG